MEIREQPSLNAFQNMYLMKATRTMVNYIVSYSHCTAGVCLFINKVALSHFFESLSSTNVVFLPSLACECLTTDELFVWTCNLVCSLFKRTLRMVQRWMMIDASNTVDYQWAIAGFSVLISCS